MNIYQRKLRWAVGLSAVALVIAGCGSGGTSSKGSSSSSGKTLVVDTYFQLKTVDPSREFEGTGQMIDKALYDSLLTFNGSNTTKLIPDLASSYTMSPDAKTLTLTLAKGRVFSDGSPVTSADVVFSLDRVIGIAGNPSFLLDGVTATAPNASTVVLTSKTPNPQLPYILTSPALGILNEKVVKAHGGTDTSKDAAEQYLNTQSAGSGPYILSTLDVSSQVKLVKNPKYNGPEKPTYGTVIIQNVQPPTQKINIQRGDAQLALDLTGDQVQGIGGNLQVTAGPSGVVIFLLLNQSPSVSEVTANADFDTAVKDAVNYSALLPLAGTGTQPATGVIPTIFTGSLPAGQGLAYDPAAAKKALAASGMGGKAVTLNYPSDNSPSGVNMNTIAQAVQAQLEAIGVKVSLAPQPTATELENYRDGKEQIGLWDWSPDYPDAADYLAFGPGALVGLRANWTTARSPAVTQLATTAGAASASDRAAAYQAYQKAMNESGPFIPLFQPANHLVAAATVSNAVYNALWTVNLAALGEK
jgi:peptide/nickel transport system substrate-binding protein